MRSFTVPCSDHQIEVDTELMLVKLYRNAWNRDSSGTPDEIYTYATLRADRRLLESLTAMLAGSDAADLEQLVVAGN